MTTIWLMYGGIFSYPNSCDPKDMIANDEFMKSMLFYSDVQCRGYYPNYKKKDYDRKAIVLLVQEGDEQVLLDGKVDYLAYSYYFTLVKGHEDTKILVQGLLLIQGTQIPIY